MKYTDRIYGEYAIDEPIIIDLINSPELQRLKDIEQAGYSNPFFPGPYRSRFDHSVGVCILLKMFGAPLEEQIAGLIHDASHSAFSHAIDYVISPADADKQSHQDNIFDEFIKNSSITDILNKYSVDVNYMLNDANFPLKEQPSPDLCADRIDYLLRDSISLGECDEPMIYIKNLTINNNFWVFKDYKYAREFADLFYKTNKRYYCGIESAVMFRTLADYLIYSLKNSYISEGDFYTTDKLVMSKINKHLGNDNELKRLSNRLNNKVKYINDAKNYEAKVSCKSRAIDPSYLDDGKVKRISDTDPDWKDIVAKESKPKVYHLKFAD